MDAVWECVIDEDKFYAAQALLSKNSVSNHDVATPVKHNYHFEWRVVWCDKCRTEMEG